MLPGIEWIVDAAGCSPAALRDEPTLRKLCGQLIADLQLVVVGDPLWHRFAGPGGVTGLYLLSESHLACHTYPEFSTATFNLYCCRQREAWDWHTGLKQHLEAQAVTVRQVPRGTESRFAAVGRYTEELP